MWMEVSYAILPTIPLVGEPGDEMWALGLRNPGVSVSTD